MAVLKVVHPRIDYTIGPGGHLTRLADQLARETPGPD